MLFTPNLGVTTDPETKEGKGTMVRKLNILTKQEVMNSFHFPSSYNTDCNRAEILLCMLACCSETLFHPPERDHPLLSQPRTEDEEGKEPEEKKEDMAQNGSEGHERAYKSIKNKFVEYLIDIQDGCSHKYADVRT
jgi:hypothetical protein